MKSKKKLAAKVGELRKKHGQCMVKCADLVSANARLRYKDGENLSTITSQQVRLNGFAKMEEDLDRERKHNAELCHTTCKQLAELRSMAEQVDRLNREKAQYAAGRDRLREENKALKEAVGADLVRERERNDDLRKENDVQHNALSRLRRRQASLESRLIAEKKEVARLQSEMKKRHLAMNMAEWFHKENARLNAIIESMRVPGAIKLDADGGNEVIDAAAREAFPAQSASFDEWEALRLAEAECEHEAETRREIEIATDTEI